MICIHPSRVATSSLWLVAMRQLGNHNDYVFKGLPMNCMLTAQKTALFPWMKTYPIPTTSPPPTPSFNTQHMYKYLGSYLKYSGQPVHNYITLLHFQTQFIPEYLYSVLTTKDVFTIHGQLQLATLGLLLDLKQSQ